MASLLPEDKTILQFSDVAPSPSKDFCQILVKPNEVTYRWWKISNRSNHKVAPGEVVDNFEDFLEDDRIHSEIHRAFGKEMLEYVKNLARGNIDYLPRLPRLILIHIMSYLELEDVARLAQVSKKFNEICTSDELWELIYRMNSETPVTDDLQQLAAENGIGWKKLFFTNKLQLQVQLRRQARKKEDEEKSFITEEGEVES